MRLEQFAIGVLAASLFAISCKKENIPAKGRTVQRPGLCKVYPTNVARIQGTIGPPPAIGDLGNDNNPLQLCVDKLAQPCLCDNYAQPASASTEFPAPPQITAIPPDSGCLNGCYGGVEDGLTTGVFRSEVTRICNDQGYPDLCAQGQVMEGCTNSIANGETLYAWPDCATIAQVSGTVYSTNGYGVALILTTHRGRREAMSTMLSGSRTA